MNPNHTQAKININHLGMLLGEAETDPEIFRAIVNLPFTEYKVPAAMMFLGIIVLLLVNPETGQVDRVALSSTELAERTTEVSAKPFNDIKIGLNEPQNTIAQAIRSGAVTETSDWETLFIPALTAEEARLNQANAGIAYSSVHPFTARSGGALIFSYYQYKEQSDQNTQSFMSAYTTLVNQRLA